MLHSPTRRPAQRIGAILCGIGLAFVSVETTTFAQESPSQPIPSVVDKKIDVKASDDQMDIKLVKIVLANGKTIEATNRQVAWKLGEYLGVAAVAKLNQKPAEEVNLEIEKAKELAKALDIEISDLPELKGFVDAFRMYRHLNSDSKSSVRTAIAKKQGDACGHVFSLSAQMILTKMLYLPIEEGKEATEIQSKMQGFTTDKLYIHTSKSGIEDQERVFADMEKVLDLMDRGNPIDKRYVETMMNTRKVIRSILHEEFSQLSNTNKNKNRSPAKADTVDDSLVTAPKNALDLSAEKLLAAFIVPNADLKKLTLKLMPTESVCKKVLADPLATKAAKVYKQLFSDPNMVIGPKPSQTEVLLRKSTTDLLKAGDRRFPGGYQRIAESLKPGFTVYELKFVRPGATIGMRFDGLIQVDGEWYLFPKIWRMVDEEPFGIKAD